MKHYFKTASYQKVPDNREVEIINKWKELDTVHVKIIFMIDIMIMIIVTLIIMLTLIMVMMITLSRISWSGSGSLPWS